MVETAPELTGILQIQQKLGEKIAVALAMAFLDDTDGMLETIGDCVKKQDAAGLRQLTHKLLGVSASIMDKETNQLCRWLEDLGDDNSWDKAGGTYEQLQGSLTKTREALKKYLDEHQPK
ncbi:MAG TPA: Hpt domain-containing protein [Candidatus Obscuribacterales bacterium]